MLERVQRFSTFIPVFRELLQNSDDAEASVVEIRFTSTACQGLADQKDTDASTLLDSKITKVRERIWSVYFLCRHTRLFQITHWTVRNNGKPFRPEDWKRITTIGMFVDTFYLRDCYISPSPAAGNPDSRTVGAFGVGGPTRLFSNPTTVTLLARILQCVFCDRKSMHIIGSARF